MKELHLDFPINFLVSHKALGLNPILVTSVLVQILFLNILIDVYEALHSLLIRDFCNTKSWPINQIMRL